MNRCQVIILFFPLLLRFENIFLKSYADMSPRVVSDSQKGTENMGAGRKELTD